MGDPHETFSIRAEVDSLYALEDRLVVAHPDWSRDQIKAERRFIYRNEMFPAQRDSFLAEKRGKEDMRSDGAYWEIIDGELTNRGYTFQSMIDNATSEQERVSLLTWRDAVLGADSGTRVVGLDYHVESEGAFKIRYADIWIKDGDTVRQEHRLNLTKGEDMDLASGIQFLRLLSQDEGKKIIFDEKTNIGLLIIQPEFKEEDHTLKEKFHTSMQAVNSDKTFRDRDVILKEYVDENIGDTGVGEVRVTPIVIIEGITKQINEIKERSEEQRATTEATKDLSPNVILLDLLTDPKKVSTLKALTQDGLDMDIEKKKEEEIVELWKSKTQQILEITPEQSLELLETVEETWQAMVGAREVIAFAVDPETEGVAIPAALFALAILAHPFENSLTGEATSKESIHWELEEESFVLDDEAHDAIVAFFADPIASLASMEVKQEQKQSSSLEWIDFTVLTWTKELIGRINEEPVELAIETIEHKEEVVLIQMGELWEVLMDRSSELQFAPEKDNEIVKKTEREHVENFSFAFTIWLLLKLDNYYRFLHSLKTFLKKEPKQDTVIEKLKKRLSEGLVQREPSQWILLAMLWTMGELQMALLRESCGAGSGFARQGKQQATGKMQTKNTFQHIGIPHGGVIFAFPS